MKQIIHTEQAPAPIGPYSQAVLVNDTLYTSGQIAIHPTTGEMILDNIPDETLQVMKNLEAVLHAAEMDFSMVVKSSIFISNMDNFQAINEVYAQFFSPENAPARETVQVARLPKDVNVEISMIAVRPK